MTIPDNEWTEYAICYNCTKKNSCNKHSGKLSYHCPEFVEDLKHTPLNKQNVLLLAHYKTRTLKVQCYIENVSQYYEIQPFFFDKSNMFWLWNKELKCWQMTDEIDLMNLIEKELGFFGETIPSSIKNGYLEAFKRIGRKHTPKDAPKNWVQFKDKIFDITTKNIIDPTPEYFTCNPIPWQLGSTTETPIMDKLLTEWVGENNLTAMYEIISYCCLTDYPIHRIFCFIGTGRNGKSCCQNLITKFIGKENITGTELDNLLDSRFESAKLYKKLVCTVGETNFGIMEKTSLIKKLVGQDQISFEFKGKTPFTAPNYAKIIISSNQLPTSTDESEGFFRRWLIMDFPNNFPEGKDILNIIPDTEYEALALKVTHILPVLIGTGMFHNEGSIAERQQKYEMASNPLKQFIATSCVLDEWDSKTRYSELFIAYTLYLKKNHKRPISHKVFSTLLASEGLEVRHGYDKETDFNGVLVFNIKLKDKSTLDGFT